MRFRSVQRPLQTGTGLDLTPASHCARFFVSESSVCSRSWIRARSVLSRIALYHCRLHVGVRKPNDRIFNLPQSIDSPGPTLYPPATQRIDSADPGCKCFEISRIGPECAGCSGLNTLDLKIGTLAHPRASAREMPPHNVDVSGPVRLCNPARPYTSPSKGKGCPPPKSAPSSLQPPWVRCQRFETSVPLGNTVSSPVHRFRVHTVVYALADFTAVANCAEVHHSRPPAGWRRRALLGSPGGAWC